jgi:hypothetical protein
MNVSNVILKIIFVHNSLVTDYADRDMVIPDIVLKDPLFLCAEFKLWSQGSKMLFQIFLY